MRLNYNIIFHKKKSQKQSDLLHCTKLNQLFKKHVLRVKLSKIWEFEAVAWPGKFIEEKV